MRNGVRRLYRKLRRLIAYSCFIAILTAGSVYAEGIRINVLANGKTLSATLDDTPAGRMLYEQLPITMQMRNIYGWQMSSYMLQSLPTGKMVANNYKVGDIIYWPFKRTLVILYKQNGERFQRQHIGHIDSGVEVFEGSGDTIVTFVPYSEEVTNP